VSETLGLGTTEYVHIIRSGYSSRILEIRRVPIPAPVPPPSECEIWKPARWLFQKCIEMSELTLKTIGSLGLLACHIQHAVNKFSSLSVVCKDQKRKYMLIAFDRVRDKEELKVVSTTTIDC